MEELQNNMNFAVVVGAINEGMRVIKIGGYVHCKKSFDTIRMNNPEERVFLMMEVDTWRTKQ